METYKRNSTKKIYLLRLLFFVLLLLIIFLFQSGLTDYAYVFVMILLFAAVFRISTISIDPAKLQIISFYFFGLVPRKISFDKEEPVSLHSFEMELNDLVTTDTGLEDIFGTTAVIRKYILQSIGETGNLKQATIGLCWDELQLVKKYFIVLNEPKR